MSITYSFRIAPDDMPVRGNAMASGDGAFDREVEDEIIARLNRGEVEAWCVVIVTATIKVDGQTFKGEAALGGCSYASEVEIKAEFFEADSHGLKNEAVTHLEEVLVDAVRRGAAAQGALMTLGKG